MASWEPQGSRSLSLSLLRGKKLSRKAVLPSRASPLSAQATIFRGKKRDPNKYLREDKPSSLPILASQYLKKTYAQIAPGSGLARKHSIDIGAGVIDVGYRGPVGVILFYLSDINFEVKVGDRVAQLIMEKIVTPNIAVVEDLDSTLRGDGGFGLMGM